MVPVVQQNPSEGNLLFTSVRQMQSNDKFVCYTQLLSERLPSGKRHCTLVTVNPALQKGLSEDADVADMQRYIKANCFSKGNRTAVLRHHPARQQYLVELFTSDSLQFPCSSITLLHVVERVT